MVYKYILVNRQMKRSEKKDGILINMILQGLWQENNLR